MTKRSFGIALFIASIGISLVGCACGQQKVVEETPPPNPPAVVQPTPQRPPAVVQPAPVPKTDRN
jgi:hypothetical protein